LKKLLLIALAVVTLIKIVDFVFYGRNGYDLMGAAGFGLLLAGAALDRRRAFNAPATGSRARQARIATVCGVVLVLVYFLLKMKIIG
jgi:hypothetical protein